jgi:hypothetical protein
MNIAENGQGPAEALERHKSNHDKRQTTLDDGQAPPRANASPQMAPSLGQIPPELSQDVQSSRAHSGQYHIPLSS